MPTMQEVRAKFPQYNDMSDEQLATALHRKFYSDMPFDQFATKVGLTAPQTVNTEGKVDRERSWGETALDAAKSFGTGVEQGVIGLAGLPADVGRFLGGMAGRGVNWAMGVPPEEAARREAAANETMGSFPFAPPTSASLTKMAESIHGPMYKPETTAGEYFNTIGQMVSGAMAGPGGVVRKAALAVVPGVASEAAGQATDGSAWEPVARAAGGLVGGVAAASRPGSAMSAMRKEVGNVDAAHTAVKVKTDALYGQLRQAGVRYDANAVDQAIQDVAALRFNDKLAPKAAGLREEFVQHLGQGMDFQSLDDLERIGTGLLRSNIDNTDRKFINDILHKIRGVRQYGAVATNGSIPANAVNPMIGQAKELARRNILADQIDEMGRKAGYYVSGTESGLRNQFASYLKSQKGKGLSKAEQEAFDAVIRREGLMNVAHMMGSRFSMPMLGGAGVLAGSPLAGLLGMGTNFVARKGMEMSTKKAVNNALKTVLAGRDAQNAASAGKEALKAERRLQGLLAAEGSTVGTRTGAQEPFLIDAQGRPYYVPQTLLGR